MSARGNSGNTEHRVIIPETEIPENYTVIVTGGHVGLGYEISKYLALLGARVIIASENDVRAKAAILRIQADIMEIRGVLPTDEEDRDLASELGPPPSERDLLNQPLRLESMRLDLESLASVKVFVERFKALEYPLHLLVCNDAVINVPQEYTDDRFEKHFQHNYLSNFLLSIQLLPAMKQHRQDARVILVSSTAHTAGEFNLKNMQGKTNYNKSKWFANSQLYQVMFMYSLQRRLEGSNVSVFSIHNGTVDTLLKKDTDPSKWGTLYNVGRTLGKILRSTSKSVNNCLNVALSAPLKKLRGHFFVAGIPVTPSPTAKNDTAQEVLWRYSLDCLKEFITEADLADLRLTDEQLEELGLKDKNPLE